MEEAGVDCSFYILYSNRLLLKYLSPRSQTTNTITPEVNSLLNLKAAEAAPPLLMPANIPSILASFLVISIASTWETSIVLSTRLASKILGTYSLGHLLMPGIDDSSVGWQPIILMSGFCSFKKIEVPIIVPVVPIALTKWVMLPLVSLHISGAVVL